MMVMMIAGEIGCRSQPGEGSTFWFIIPLPIVMSPLQIVVATAGSQDHDELLVNSDKSKRRGKRGGRVLLVDDNVVNQKVCLRMLHMLEYDALVVNNGQECLDILLRGADPLYFDVILVDFHMPIPGTTTTGPPSLGTHARTHPRTPQTLLLLARTHATHTRQTHHHHSQTDWRRRGGSGPTRRRGVSACPSSDSRP
jgi:CheY-like chemotaxis protein